jgi:hypothetical protein
MDTIVPAFLLFPKTRPRNKNERMVKHKTIAIGIRVGKNEISPALRAKRKRIGNIANRNG